MSDNSAKVRVLVPTGGVAAYGAERATFRIMSALKRRGMAIHIVNRVNADASVKQLIKELGVETSMAPWGPIIGKNIVDPRRFFKALKGVLITSWVVYTAIRRFRPTHIYFTGFIAFFYTLPAFMFSSLPIVYRAGDSIPGGPWGWFFRHVIARKVSRIICISNFMKSHLLRKGAPEKKISVIYCYPPDAGMESAPSIREYRKIPGQKIISYIGRLTKEKGVDVFVQSAIKLTAARNDLMFYLAGDYSYNNPLAQELIEEVARRGLSERIQFLGFLEKPAALMSETDVLCAPTMDFEALGNVVLEAKAAGVPAVVFPTGGLPEMIEHEIDGYVCRSKTVSDLIEGVLFMVDHPERLAKAKERARRSLDRFRRDDIDAQWVRVFNE